MGFTSKYRSYYRAPEPLSTKAGMQRELPRLDPKLTSPNTVLEGLWSSSYTQVTLGYIMAMNHINQLYVSKTSEWFTTITWILIVLIPVSRANLIISGYEKITFSGQPIWHHPPWACIMQTSEMRAALVPTILPTMDYGQRERHVTSHRSWKGDPRVLAAHRRHPALRNRNMPWIAVVIWWVKCKKKTCSWSIRQDHV